MEINKYNMKYWKLEELDEKLVRISLKDKNLLSDYKFDNNKLIIGFEKITISGVIPLFNNLRLFSNRRTALDYIKRKNPHKLVIFEDDTEMSFTNKTFNYPYIGFIEDDFNNGITFRFKTKREMKKLILTLEKKFERLITTDSSYI